ncbi:MAG: ATP-binding cassette domain-containing protein [Bacillota bacterium]|jgi:molybdate transport system ATP-binding protein|nr:ATP-binding cassette domain-containing protein [Bacillota bacterium]MDD3298798.1 ATP-binding cassette domain-containing protein [Bacillota bacterium]MDD3850628.1 ATP-binding cassette domain-containing protein [Bacillota bacterium]MDD4708155.1 ATP-binding cassette domain-containing protein [Bacillota bacterium]
MLKVNGIYKAYGTQEVLKSACLEIGSEIKVLIGINGCGKSTLLKIIAGIIKSDKGNVLLREKNITHLAPEERRVGYVPQHPALFGHKSVIDNIRYGMRNGLGSEELLEDLLSMLGLNDILNKKPGELSGGYKSRVSLARALAPEPEMILLDEPLSDIDAAVKETLLPEFRRVTKLMNVPVLYVTHDPAEAEQIGDTFSVMQGGRVNDIDSANHAFEIIKKDKLISV